MSFQAIDVRWMSLDGRFREVATTTAASVKDAYELVRSVFPEAKLIDGEDPDSWRITACSLGGRPGRNVAFLDFSTAADAAYPDEVHP